MLEWCSISVMTTSSPGPTWRSPGHAIVFATRFSASVAFLVKITSSRDGALRNEATLSRACSKASVDSAPSWCTARATLALCRSRWSTIVSMTTCGFCEALALSRETSGCPSTIVRLRIGKSLRTSSRSGSSPCSSTMSGPGRCSGEALVALGLEALGELRPALLGDPPVDEDVDEVGLDVAQDPRVVGDQQDTLVAVLGEPVHALRDDAQGVDVQPGVGLVEDRRGRVEQLQLHDLVALLLSAGEALVDVSLSERGVHLHAFHGGVDVLDPGAELGGLAGDRRLGAAEEVRHRDAGHLDRVLHREEETSPGPL